MLLMKKCSSKWKMSLKKLGKSSEERSWLRRKHLKWKEKELKKIWKDKLRSKSMNKTEFSSLVRFMLDYKKLSPKSQK